MSDINITQNEADLLFKMEKIRVDDTEWKLPSGGNRLEIPLTSKDKKESFLLDLSRGRLNIERRKYQNRCRQSVIIARLDFGSPHQNPDGQEVGVPHLHLYKEGYNDKWAYALPSYAFTDLTDHSKVLNDFMKFCNITESPIFDKGINLWMI